MENESFVMQRNAKSAEALKAGKGEPQGKPIERRVAKSIPIVGTAKVDSFRTVFGEQKTAH